MTERDMYPRCANKGNRAVMVYFLETHITPLQFLM